MSLHDIPGTHVLQVTSAPIAAATATSYAAVVSMPFKAIVKWAKFVPSAAVTGNATHTQNLNVKKVVSGSATEITNKDLGAGVDLTALTAALIGTDDTLDVSLASGDLVVLEREKVGNGVALPLGTFLVGIEGG